MDQEEMQDDNTSTDLTALTTNSGDFYKTVFIIPLTAPLPLELEPFTPPSGSLLQRLAPLGDAEPSGDIALVAISGSELLTLDRAWAHLQEAKKVAVLTELPGANYDVIFDQARRSIGLRLIDWPSIMEAFAERQTQQQRVGDTQAWRADEIAEVQKKAKPRGDNLRDADRVLADPDADEEAGLTDLDDAGAL
jgi:hypothetical protein